MILRPQFPIIPRPQPRITFTIEYYTPTRRVITGKVF